MKRYFCETEDYNFIAYVDSNGKAAIIYDTAFNSGIPTLEAAMKEDYSGVYGCEDAEAVAHQTAKVEVFNWSELVDDCIVTEF